MFRQFAIVNDRLSEIFGCANVLNDKVEKMSEELCKFVNSTLWFSYILF